MQIQSTSQDGVAVLTLDGDVLGGPDGSALHDALAEARGDGPLKAVVDLSGVRFMNSSGLGMLVGALTSARNTGGDLRLSAVAERVLAILQVTQLDGVFQRFDSVDAAVASFKD